MYLHVLVGHDKERWPSGASGTNLRLYESAYFFTNSIFAYLTNSSYLFLFYFLNFDIGKKRCGGDAPNPMVWLMRSTRSKEV